MWDELDTFVKLDLVLMWDENALFMVSEFDVIEELICDWVYIIELVKCFDFYFSIIIRFVSLSCRLSAFYNLYFNFSRLFSNLVLFLYSLCFFNYFYFMI